MDWRNYYESRIITAQEAVDKIKSGDRVVLGHACGEPAYLVDAMVDNYQAYENVEIVHMVAMGKGLYTKPEMKSHFRHNTYFVGACTRDAVNGGWGDFTPCFFYEIPSTFSTTMPPDVALVQVTPPNEEGICSLGVSVDYTLEAIKKAKLVIAQVNSRMPFTLGQSTVPVTEIDYFVPHDHQLIMLSPPNIGDTEKMIGENCASLVKDGDTLQLGIGAIPDAVLLFLKDKHDLGIHSEMFSDGVVELVEAGVVTNKKKNFMPGKAVATFLMGTQRLYDYVHMNPDVAMMPVDYVNHPMVAAQNDNLVSINSCVQVDLMGQVASESVGFKQISGIGGQLDFVRSAAMSKGGRSIIAMPSTAGGGKFSKIVPLLDTGAAVTTGRCDVDYIITEFGIAHLKGRTLKDRARLLISVAHPNFRHELIEEFKCRFNCEY